jgi:hypothetical protein
MELLAVTALLALLAGLMGLAWRNPGDTSALQGGQDLVASLCGAARIQAVLDGVDARLIVAVDPGDTSAHLRYLQIVREDPAHPGQWRADGSGYWLPRGVFIVPPAGAAVPGNPDWPATRCSTALSASTDPLTINGVLAGQFYHLQYAARGTTGGGSIVLTMGRWSGEVELTFDNPDNVRGVLVRSSGALTLLDDAGAFSP